MGCKTKYKGKQKLQSGGNVVYNFDVSSLSPEQQAYYNILDSKQQAEYRNNFAQQSNADQGSSSNVVSSASSVGSLIGMIQGVAGELAGEQDQYGQSSSELTAFFEGVENIGGNLEQAQNRWKEEDYLGAIGAFFNPGFSESWFDEAKASEEKRKEQDELLRTTSMVKSSQQSFKDGGKVKEKDTGTLELPEEEIKSLYGEDEGEKPSFSADEVISGMLKKGYTPFPEERADRIQNSYQMSESDKAVYDAFETKDIQEYMINELGLDLDDFGIDNVYGKETGEIFAKYIEQKSNPIASKQPEEKVKYDKNIDRILYYGPSGQIYQANPNDFDMEGAEKNFTRSADRETLQYLTETAGMDYDEAKELMKTEEGKKQLVSEYNKYQGYTDKMAQSYATQGNFPVYKKGKLKGLERIFDDEGNLILKDVNQLNYKEGGTVQGEGTGKSDSIETELDPGDFVIPTDTPISKNALSKVMKILELDNITTKSDLDKVAKSSSNSTDVKISNGEKIIPKDKVMDADMLLREMGYRNGLKDAAPNAEYEFDILNLI